MTVPIYLKNFVDTGQVITTNEGITIPLWELSVPDDEECLKEWASLFRQNYCIDAEIDDLRSGLGISRKDYLLSLVFPDETIKPGPSIRAGDFAELMISDYVEHILGYWVPRDKFAEKESRNESAKGVDILGFKLCPKGNANADELITFEVKAQLSGARYSGRLQTAIDDSDKDYVRSAISLNAAKRRFVRAKDQAKVDFIARFQNIADRPYIFKSGAAAMLSGASFNEAMLKASSVNAHTNKGNLSLIVIKGNDLMTLAHSIYTRAANDA